jgi:hypothetical protein
LAALPNGVGPTGHRDFGIHAFPIRWSSSIEDFGFHAFPMRWSSCIEDFGFHALTVGFEEGGMRDRRRSFSQILRDQGNNPWPRLHGKVAQREHQGLLKASKFLPL